MAAANAANSLLGPLLIPLDRSGLMLLSLGIGYMAMILNRAFVGDTLIALASRRDGEERDRLVRNGLTTAALAGVGCGLLLVIVWLVRPRGGSIDLLDLIWIAPFLPAIMSHDTARAVYLSDRKPEKALVIDLVWAGTQAVLVTVMLVGGMRSPGWLLASWGVGAVAGCTVFFVREGHRPWRGNPKAWLAETKHLSGWFTATGVIGQVQIQAVNFLIGIRLSSAQIGGYRFVQTLEMQPVQNFITAVSGLIVPRTSRHADAAAKLPGAEADAAVATVRRQTRTLALAFGGLGVLFVLIAWPLLGYILGHTKKYAIVASLPLPISLQCAVYLVQVPFTAALRAMHRAKLLFFQYVVFSTVALSGLVIGSTTSGLPGAVWGLFAGTFTGLLVMIAMYLRAVRGLRSPQTGAASGTGAGDGSESTVDESAVSK
jgi:O-antigen/teichoic acid export membrane protein